MTEVTDAATRSIDFSSVPYLLGYVQTRAKSGATVSLTTDRGDPLYAHWRLGRGRAAVFTSDCKNRWMAEWIGEGVYQQFWAQVANHLMRPASADEDRMDMEVSVRDGRGHVLIDAIDEQGHFINDMVSTVSVAGPDGFEVTFELHQTAAGRYEGDFELPSYGAYVLEGSHTLGEDTLGVSLVTLTNPYPQEYRYTDPDHEALAQAVALAGGVSNPEVAALFDVADDERLPVEAHTWPLFLFAAVGLLLLDVCLRRIRLYGRINLSWAQLTGKT